MHNLSEQELGQALFYSIKREDYDHAEFLLRLDAPVNTSYFIEQDCIAYTPNLLVGKVAQTIKRYGISHAQSQQLLRILDSFLTKKCDLRCHCIPKNPHYCAIAEVFKHSPLNTTELLSQENILVLKLLYHGATFKNCLDSKDELWTALEHLKTYIVKSEAETIELIRLNRHSKGCASRHTSCKIRPTKKL